MLRPVALTLSLLLYAPLAAATIPCGTGSPGPSGFNVTDYGATPHNDADDDRVAIQCAIDAATNYGNATGAPTGGLVYFPEGVYVIGNTLHVNQQFISLAGQGPGTTTILRAPSFTTGDTIRVVYSSDPTLLTRGNNISNLRLLASGDTTSGAHLHLINCAHAVFSNLALDEQYGGIQLEGGFSLTFSNVDIFADWQFAPGVKSGSYLVRVDPGTNEDTHRTATDINFIGGNWRSTRGSSDARVEYGLRIHSADAVYFTNVHILGGALADVLIDPAAGPLPQGNYQVSGLRFANCWLDQPGTSAMAGMLIQGQTTTMPYGLFTIDGTMFWGGGGAANQAQVAGRGLIVNSASLKGLVLSDSTIWGFASHGVHILAGSNVLLTGNQISNNKSAPAWAAGIMVQAGVSDFQILNNTVGPNLVTATTQHSAGIAVASGASDRYSIVGNVVLNVAPGGVAIADYGTGTKKLISANLQ